MFSSIAAVALLCLSGCSGLQQLAASGDVLTRGAPSASPSPTDATHASDATFTGIVTGYTWAEDRASDNPTRVRVDDAPVDLDLVWTYSAACRDDVDEAKAIAIKKAILPIGKRVTVTRSRPGEDWSGFITAPGAPGSSGTSINEQLVGSGYWVPSGTAFNGVQVQYGDDRRYVLDRNELTPAQRIFAPPILEEGNRARAHRIGGQRICIDQILKHRRAEKKAWADIDASIEREQRRQAEYARSHPAGPCRDGDGDGVCYER